MPIRRTLGKVIIAMAAGAILNVASAAPADRWTLPVAVEKLPNGLTVVISEDHSSPTVGIAVVYKVGIRTEPRGRAGFAHLFEHLMFEGTPDAPQGVFDEVVAQGGGDNNASTHPDFTSYVERAPASALEALLWLEADRMQTLAFSQARLDAQRAVVKEEIRVNVLNQPYGGFAQTDLPLLAFSKWESGHDGYGSFDDLDRASVADVRDFHRDYYGPNDAVLGIAGDITPAQGFALAQKYFGAIPARTTPPRPDVDEPLNTAEKRKLEGDGLAKLPALAIGWKMPPRGSADQAAMIVLGQLLAGGGDASRLYQTLVKGSALAVQVEDFTGSGSPWEYDGPTLYTVTVIHKVDAKPDAVLAALDAQIARVVKEGVDPATLQALKTRLIADWYDELEPFVDRAEKLAVLQALWGDANVANRVPDLIEAVTAADMQRVAATYLTDANRSIIERVPDFMLKPNDPARSDRRAKARPVPAKRVGTVSVGALQSVEPSVPTSPAPSPAASGEVAPKVAPPPKPKVPPPPVEPTPPQQATPPKPQAQPQPTPQARPAPAASSASKAAAPETRGASSKSSASAKSQAKAAKAVPAGATMVGAQVPAADVTQPKQAPAATSSKPTEKAATPVPPKGTSTPTASPAKDASGAGQG